MTIIALVIAQQVPGGVLGQSSPPLVLADAQGVVTQVAFSKDSSWVATASTDKVARLYSLPAGTLHSSLTDATDSVTSVSFSPDSALLATGSADSVVRIYSLPTAPSDATAPVLTHTLKEAKGMITAVSFSGNGKLFASATAGAQDAATRLYSLPASSGPATDPPKLKQTLTTGGAGDLAGLSSLAFSPDSAWLVVGSRDHKARVYADLDLESVPTAPKYTLADSEAAVLSVAISPAGNWLAVGGYDNRTRVYEVDGAKGELDTGRPKFTLTNPPYSPGGYPGSNGVNSVGFTPCSRFLATGSDDTRARVYALNCTGPFTPPHCEPGSLMYQIPGAANGLLSVGFSPDYAWFGTGSSDGKARLYKKDHHQHRAGAGAAAETTTETLLI